MKHRRAFAALAVLALVLIAGACMTDYPFTPEPPADIVLFDYSDYDSWNSTDTPLEIPANGDPVTSTITVTGVGTYVHAITVTLNITHTYIDDLHITLVYPGGSSTLIADGPDGSGNNMTNTVLHNSAVNAMPTCTAPCTGTYRPQELFTFGGQANGDWKLVIYDQYTETDEGDLANWTLELGTDDLTPTPTVSPTPSLTYTPTSTRTPTPTRTLTPTVTGTPPTPTPSPYPTWTATRVIAPVGLECDTYSLSGAGAIPDEGTLKLSANPIDAGYVITAGLTITITHTAFGDLNLDIVDPRSLQWDVMGSYQAIGNGTGTLRFVSWDASLPYIGSDSWPYEAVYEPQDLNIGEVAPKAGSWDVFVTDSVATNTGSVSAATLTLCSQATEREAYITGCWKAYSASVDCTNPNLPAQAATGRSLDMFIDTPYDDRLWYCGTGPMYLEYNETFRDLEAYLSSCSGRTGSTWTNPNGWDAGWGFNTTLINTAVDLCEGGVTGRTYVAGAELLGVDTNVSLVNASTGSTADSGGVAFVGGYCENDPATKCLSNIHWVMTFLPCNAVVSDLETPTPVPTFTPLATGSPSPTPSLTPTPSVTPRATYTPRPTGTPTPGRFITEVLARPIPTGTPCTDWNERSQCGANDSYVEIGADSPGSISGWVIEVRDGDGALVCQHVYESDNMTGPLKVIWLDEMTDENGTAPCDVFPLNGKAILFNGQATPVSTRVYPTPAVHGKSWAAQEWNTPEPWGEYTPSPGTG